MKNRTFPWAIIALAAVAGAGFAGVANYVRHQNPANVSTKTPDDSGNMVAENNPTKDQGTKNTNESTNQETVVKITKADVLNKALKSQNYGEFRVLNVVVDNGNAIIDFNKELLGGMGSGAESDFIQIIKYTLKKYDDVNTFQIRIDGEIRKSLSHFEMIDPVPVR